MTQRLEGVSASAAEIALEREAPEVGRVLTDFPGADFEMAKV